MEHCGRCHACGNLLEDLFIIETKPWCSTCKCYRLYPSHGHGNNPDTETNDPGCDDPRVELTTGFTLLIEESRIIPEMKKKHVHHALRILTNHMPDYRLEEISAEDLVNFVEMLTRPKVYYCVNCNQAINETEARHSGHCEACRADELAKQI